MSTATEDMLFTYNGHPVSFDELQRIIEKRLVEVVKPEAPSTRQDILKHIRDSSSGERLFEHRDGCSAIQAQCDYVLNGVGAIAKGDYIQRIGLDDTGAEPAWVHWRKDDFERTFRPVDVELRRPDAYYTAAAGIAADAADAADAAYADAYATLAAENKQLKEHLHIAVGKIKTLVNNCIGTNETMIAEFTSWAEGLCGIANELRAGIRDLQAGRF